MIQNKEHNFVSAVAYLSNGSKLITEFLETINSQLSSNFKDYEIIMVNDKSKDNGVELTRDFAAKNKGVKVSILNMSFHQGLESAMKAGVELAIGDFVYEFDTIAIDYDPNLVMDIYRHSLKGYDIVSASADVKSRIRARMFYSILNKNAQLQYNVGSETFRILSRRAINRVNSLAAKIPYRKAIYANCGLKIDNLQYKITKKIKPTRQSAEMELALNSLVLFTNIAYKVTLTLAILMSIFTVGVAIYAVVFYMLENPVAGWTTTILFLSFAFCGLFIILAMVIKYLSIIVSLNFSKKEYMFESIEKL